MQKYAISPAVIEAMRSRVLAERQKGAAQLPLYLPAYDEYRLPARSTPGFAEYDADDARIEAGGVTVGEDADDDFY